MQDHPTSLVSLRLADAARVTSPQDRHTNLCVRRTSGPDSPTNDLMFAAMNENVLAAGASTSATQSGAYAVWLNKNYSRGELTLNLGRSERATPRAAAHALR